MSKARIRGGGWVFVTFITKPEPYETLLKFYSLVQPGGWWGNISNDFDHTMTPVTKGFVLNWVSGIIMIYGFTFGIGSLIFMKYSQAVLLLGCSAVGSFLVWRGIRN